ncbi:chromatin-remodeling complex subunit ies6 [Quaeritorhiza haematococci]|nr:chromatin-remodeling complex subunit ies6 [Quaeritorhiza haematococci]
MLSGSGRAGNQSGSSELYNCIDWTYPLFISLRHDEEPEDNSTTTPTSAPKLLIKLDLSLSTTTTSTKLATVPSEPVDEDEELLSPASSTTPAIPPLNMATVHKPFKNPHYKTPKKFKNLKQIIVAEKNGQVAGVPEPSLDQPTYWNIEVPPSILPAKKYCDITGLEAPYTDPQSGLRYHNMEVFQYIRTLPQHQIQEYLKLRNAAIRLK